MSFASSAPDTNLRPRDLKIQVIPLCQRRPYFPELSATAAGFKILHTAEAEFYLYAQVKNLLHICLWALMRLEVQLEPRAGGISIVGMQAAGAGRVKRER